MVERLISEIVGIILRYLLLPAGALAVFIGVLAHLLKNPGKIQTLEHIFTRSISALGKVIPGIRNRLEYRLVSTGIESAINTSFDEVSNESSDLLVNPVRIKWTKGEDARLLLKEGYVLIRLNAFTNQDDNLIAATTLYVEKAFLPRAKQFMDVSLRTACEQYMIRRVLSKPRKAQALQVFHQDVYLPQLRSLPTLESDTNRLHAVDRKGLLTRIFFNEVGAFVDRILPAPPTDEITTEIRAFSEFLGVLAERVDFEDVPTSYKGQGIEISVMPVAKRAKIKRGIVPYLEHIRGEARSGIPTIYLCVWGKDLFPKGRRILEWAQKQGWMSVSKVQAYDDRSPGHEGDRTLFAECEQSRS